MSECSTCGAELEAHEIRCPICGKPTSHYHRQRRCLHCGTPAAEQAKTCLMCGRPVDSLPLRSSVFSGSWRGVGLGVVIIAVIVIGFIRYPDDDQEPAQAVHSPASRPTLTPTHTATPNPTNTPSPTAPPTATPTPTPRLHIVEFGENPSYIADLYGVTVDEIVALNNIDDVLSLRVGQELLIPAPRDGEDPSVGRILPPQIVYQVESGDTLLDIALRHGTSVEAISAANPTLNLDLIYPGQDLVVPLATPTATPTSTATSTPTPTPGPLYAPPNLLNPIDDQVVEGSTLLFNWTATGLLAEDQFYVLQLSWPDGSQTEYWTKSTAWRIARGQRPAAGPITWTVTIMRRTGSNADGSPMGERVSGPGQTRRVDWL